MLIPYQYGLVKHTNANKTLLGIVNEYTEDLQQSSMSNKNMWLDDIHKEIYL